MQIYILKQILLVLFKSFNFLQYLNRRNLISRIKEIIPYTIKIGAILYRKLPVLLFLKNGYSALYTLLTVYYYVLLFAGVGV